MAFLSPASAKVIYVDKKAPGLNNGSSWVNAYNYLQNALAAASVGDEIWVADGIYRPDEYTAHPYGTGDRTATFSFKNGVAIYGGFQGYIYTPPPPPPMSLSNARGDIDWEVTIQPGISAATNASLDESDPNVRDIELYETILSGDLAENDIKVDPCDLLTEPTRAENSYWISGSRDANESTVLDGFTITGGNANNFEGGYYVGSGMSNGGGRPTISNCTFTRNSAYYGGGMYNIESSPTLIYCTFSENSAKRGGGIINEKNSSPMLINCMFSKNCASGQYSNGGGIYNGDCSNPTIVNCIFTGNFAGFGGGGICNVSYSRATLSNCTFANNSAVNYGGAIYWEYSTLPPPIPTCTTRWLIITNCIIRGNSDSSGSGESAQIYSGLTPTVNYNCIQGLTGALGGTGNIDADPLFVDADGADNIPGTEDDNLRLLPGSPCIDAGDNSSLPPSVVTDLDGEPRIANGTVDMGAYEGPDQGLLLSAESVIVGEGQTATFTVALAMDPCGTFDVNVAHYSGDTDITVQSGEHLIFDSSNYSQPKTVTLKASEDSDSINGQALFRLSGPGLPPSGVTATEQENDTILYVDTHAVAGGNNGRNWANAFTDLQDALTAASLYMAVNEIRVAQGVFTPAGPGGDRMASFQLINGVTLKGGYAGFGEPDPNERDIELYESILSGDLDGNDVDVNNPEDLLNEPTRAENSYFIIIADSTNSTAVLDGFTITGAGSKDYGVAMINYKSSTKVTNCKFTGNLGWSGAAMFNLEASPTLYNCVFSRNASDWRGAGIENSDSNTILINCRFINNWTDFGGGGMYNWNCNPVLSNCTFVGNSARIFGGGMWNNSYGNPTLTNCTFTDNSAWEGGGIFNEINSISVLSNCILWGNINGEIEGGAIVLYSDVQGGWVGLGNIDTDPCFVDPNNGDYHLKSQAGRWDPNSEMWIKDDVTSPGIDAANPGCPEANEPVPNGNRRNMGAYGGTAEASKSPAYWRSIADTTNDWIVDSNDLKVFADYWLQMGECIPSDFDRSQSVDFDDFAILGGQWRQKRPGPGITYEIGGCIPVDFALSAAGESEPTRFTVTVEGSNIYFEDTMRANCCPEELDVQMTVEGDLITIYEIERFFTRPPCPCICDYPITATFGPFEPGIYTLEVYQDGYFIGTTTVTIENGQ